MLITETIYETNSLQSNEKNIIIESDYKNDIWLQSLFPHSLVKMCLLLKFHPSETRVSNVHIIAHGEPLMTDKDTLMTL